MVTTPSSLPEDRYDITLATYPGGELIQWIKIWKLRGEACTDYRYSSACREISPFYDISIFCKLYGLMKKERYDIAHFHSSKMGILGGWLPSWLECQIHFTVHGWGSTNTSRDGCRRYWGLLKRWQDEDVPCAVCFTSSHG